MAKCHCCICYFYPQKLYLSQRLGLFYAAEVAEALFGLMLAHVQQKPIGKLPSSLSCESAAYYSPHERYGGTMASHMCL